MLCHAIIAWCRLYDVAIVDIFRLQCVVSSSRMVHCRLEYESSLTMIRKVGKINGIARDMLQQRRNMASLVRQDKTKYNRKKDKDNANKNNTDEERKD